MKDGHFRRARSATNERAHVLAKFIRGRLVSTVCVQAGLQAAAATASAPAAAAGNAAAATAAKSIVAQSARAANEQHAPTLAAWVARA